MAFCTNCGAQLPEGSSFCNYCGAKLASAPAPRPAAPTYAAPAYGAPAGYPAPAPAPRKSHTGLIIGIVAALVLIGAVIGILFATGVLGGGSAAPTNAYSPAPTPTPTPTAAGTWMLAEPYNDDGDTMVLVLKPGGNGYTKEFPYGSSYPEYGYYPLTWTESSITVKDEAVFSYTWAGDTMTLTYGSETLTMIRTAPDEYSDPNRVPEGTYSLVSAIQEGRDITADLLDYFGQFAIRFDGGGSGTIIAGASNAASMTYDDFFIYYDGPDPMFYHYDNGQVTLLVGSAIYLFSR